MQVYNAVIPQVAYLLVVVVYINSDAERAGLLSRICGFIYFITLYYR